MKAFPANFLGISPTTALRPSLVLKHFWGIPAFYEEIPKMTWDSSGNGTFAAREEVCCRAHVRNERLS